MPVNVLSKRYAKAVFDIAKDNGRIDEALEQLRFLSKALMSDRKLAEFWENPMASFLSKRQILNTVFEKMDLEEFIQRFIMQLLLKGRLRQLRDILHEYESLLEDFRRVLEVKVVSARKLSDDRVELLKKVLGEKIGREVTLASETDPSLIGGLLLTIDDYVYDGTVTARLNALLRH
jgi:F-type H+-transporting ATPase subunit delta